MATFPRRSSTSTVAIDPMRRPAIIPRHNRQQWLVGNPAGARHHQRSCPAPHRVQTAIVGAGICGMAVAHQLGKLCPDADIALIEAERAGYGASGRNAGFMLNVPLTRPSQTRIDILRRNMRLWASGLSDLRRMVRDFQIDCDWHEFGRFYGSARSRW